MAETKIYIFADTAKCTKAIKSVAGRLKKTNRNLTLTIFAMTCYNVLSEMDRWEQKKKLKELSEKIEDMKRPKGE